ncbi:MAG: hypothetical protein ABH836_07215 [Candidatus Omnitrophota bacterium]
MENKDLLKRLNRLGFSLFDANYDLQVNETISELVKSNDTRLWEGFPVVIANVSKENIFNIDKIKDILKGKKEYNNFHALFLISIALYKFLNLRALWVNELYDNLKSVDKEKAEKFLNDFKNGKEFIVSEKRLNSERLGNIFNNYFNQYESDVSKVKNNYEELSLEYAMSQIFTTRQKEIFLKRSQGKKMTKTEREYFYRVIKKKAMALANEDLHILAKKTIV